jgi:hypothetical protein
MRASTKRNGTGCGKTSVDKIATGPVGLLDTVVGRWLVLGQKRYISSKLQQNRALRLAECSSPLRAEQNLRIECFG